MMWALLSAGSSVVKGSEPSALTVLIASLDASHALDCTMLSTQ